MSSPGLVRRLLASFARKSSPPPTLPVVRPPSAPRVVVSHEEQDAAVPLHPLVAGSGGAGASMPIVVGAAPTPGGRAPLPAAVVEFVDEVKQLPLFSSTAMQLMRSIDQDDVNADELARLISADAGLVAQLLRIVNSPYYALPQPCATVSGAIAVLGFDQVRRTVLAAVTQRPLMAYLHDTRIVQAFWRHQLLCAALARHLAVRNGLDGESAYMAGLMHEVGRLAILIRHPHLTDVLLDVEGDDDHFATRHQRVHFGFDHAQVGGALLAKWGLPDAIVRATAEHEDAALPADPVSAAVWRANLLAHDLLREPEELDQASPWMLAIDMTLDERRRMFADIAALEGGNR